MKKSDIIDLTLKIFGIYIIITAIISLKDFHFTRFAAALDPDSINYFGIITLAVALSILLLIGYFLIFRSSKIARKICKEDYEINLSFDLNYNKILEIALIIIGLFILIFKFGNLISSFSQLFNQITGNFPVNQQSISFIVATILQYVFGYMLLTNAKAVTTWIIKINKKNLGEVEN